ncbi:flagellar export protein FliJ [Desulforegula conservatrix]|uniref:flagellar export protein FliJ n=1 Tax=Desulforegula conservatrix TaxID=153026 RepID=UPI0003F9668C|nr:flagellar export protein FliJ [Desulforegula conservatrix]
MKKFRFSLEPLLKYRTFMEQKAKQELAEALKNLSDCEEQIKKLENDKINAMVEMDREMAKGISSDQYRLHTSFIDSLDAMILSEEDRRIRLMKVVREKQQALAKRSVDKKAIENLKQKKRTEYLEEMASSQQKIADEIIMVRKARENLK